MTIYNDDVAGETQRTQINYDLAQLENCPDLLVTVWLEVPTTHEYTIATADEMTQYQSLDEVTAANHTHEFNTTKLSGEYFAHVSITPYGLECAFAITEDCTSELVYSPCEAEAFGLSARSVINMDLDDVTVLSEDNLVHTIDFSMNYEKFWNCDLEATVTVYQAGGNSTEPDASIVMDRDELSRFI